VSTHDCDASITHPSEHNAVLVVGQPLSESRRASRTVVHAKWDKQTRANVAKGKLPADGWEATSIRRAEGHEQAFMQPFPDPNLAPVAPYGAETCAAHDGRVLYERTLSAKHNDGIRVFYVGSAGGYAGTHTNVYRSGCTGGCGGGCGGGGGGGCGC